MKSPDTQLRDAAFLLDARKVKALLGKGASPRRKDKDGTELLFSVCGSVMPLTNPGKAADLDTIIRAAVAAGADVNQKYAKFSGFTPLILAASAGNAGAVRTLIELGAAVDEPDEHRFTPLHRAALSGRAEAVKVLLEFGADPNRKTSTKDDALQLAIDGRDESSGLEGEDYRSVIAILKKRKEDKGMSAAKKKSAAAPEAGKKTRTTARKPEKRKKTGGKPD